MSADRKVDLIVAGVQKAGTTALFDHLGEIPGIGRSRVKETHFFDDDTRIDWSRPDYDAYHALFPADAAVRAEATPIYVYWPNALERIRDYHPGMKIVLMLRDPIERAWSHWQMEYARGLETEPFAWCIRAGRARVRAGDATAPGYHRVFSYVERGFYAGQLRRLLALFPRENVRVYAADRLRVDPDPVIRDLCDLVGIAPPSHAILPRTAHGARRIAYPSRLDHADIALLRDLYAVDIAETMDILGRPQTSGIYF